MINLIVIAFFVWYSTSITWVLYLAVMAMKRQRHQITMPAKIFGYPVLFIGIIVDIAYNLTAGTILFLEPPQEWLFTNRCERHLKRDNFRGRIARWFCRHFLDPFDPAGKHCG